MPDSGGSPSSPQPRLHCCHECRMIGDLRESHARAHEIVKGHEVVLLSQEDSDAIREEWTLIGDPRGSQGLTDAGQGESGRVPPDGQASPGRRSKEVSPPTPTYEEAAS